MCCLELFCIHSISTHIELHILISHVSEDDGLFTQGLTVSPLVAKGLNDQTAMRKRVKGLLFFVRILHFLLMCLCLRPINYRMCNLMYYYFTILLYYRMKVKCVVEFISDIIC